MAWDTMLLLSSHVICDTLSRYLRALFRWLSSIGSSAEATVDWVRCCEQFVMPLDYVKFHVHNDQPTCSNSRGCSRT